MYTFQITFWDLNDSFGRGISLTTDDTSIENATEWAKSFVQRNSHYKLGEIKNVTCRKDHGIMYV